MIKALISKLRNRAGQLATRIRTARWGNLFSRWPASRLGDVPSGTRRRLERQIGENLSHLALTRTGILHAELETNPETERRRSQIHDQAYPGLHEQYMDRAKQTFDETADEHRASVQRGLQAERRESDRTRNHAPPVAQQRAQERDNEIQRMREQAKRAPYDAAHQNLTRFFQDQFGLGEHFNFLDFHRDVAQIAGEENAQRLWDPDAPRQQIEGQFTRALENQSRHTELSKVFTVNTKWYQPRLRKQTQDRVDRLMFRHYFGSHLGYEHVDRLLQTPGIDFGHIVRQVEKKGPREFFSQLDAQQVGAKFEEARSKASFAKVKKKALWALLIASIPGLAKAGSTVIPEWTHDYYAGKAQAPTARIQRSQNQPGPSAPGPVAAPAEAYRGSGNFFLKLGQEQFPREHHPNFSAPLAEVHAALMEGRADDLHWLAHTEHGTQLIQNRETRRAMEKESRRIANRLRTTLKGLGPNAFKPVQSTKSGPQYDPYHSTFKLAVSLGLKEDTARKVAIRVGQMQR